MFSYGSILIHSCKCIALFQSVMFAPQSCIGTITQAWQTIERIPLLRIQKAFCTIRVISRIVGLITCTGINSSMSSCICKATVSISIVTTKGKFHMCTDQQRLKSMGKG